MNNKNSNHPVKDNIKMILRGYKIVFSIYSKYILWNILNIIVKTLTPYFSLLMTSRLINEISLGGDLQKLLSLALITVSVLFLFNIINRVLQGFSNVYGSDTWRLDLLYYLNKQNKMQYSYLENPEISLLREEIYSAKTSTGGGIPILLWNIETMVTAIINIVCSVILTISLFLSKTPHTEDSLGAVLNSPITSLVVIVLILINAAVSVITTNKETQKVESEWMELSTTNKLFRALNLWERMYIFLISTNLFCVN